MATQSLSCRPPVSTARPTSSFKADDGLEIVRPFDGDGQRQHRRFGKPGFPAIGSRALAVGDGTQIIVVGDFSDEQGVVLAPSYLTFRSTNPATATISTGGLVGVAQGTSILTVSAQGLQAVTAVTVGPVAAVCRRWTSSSLTRD